MPKEEIEVKMTFDNLENTVSPEIAAARGDIFESTEPVDPFSMTENLMNPSEDEGVMGVVSDKAKQEEKQGDPEGATKDYGDDLELREGQVEHIPYPRFQKSIQKNKVLTDENAALKAELERIRLDAQNGVGTEGDVTAVDVNESANRQPSPVPAAKANANETAMRDKLTAMASEHSDAVIDGDHEKATTIMAGMMELQADMAAEKSMHKIAERNQQASVQGTVDDLVSRHAEYFNSPVRLNIFTEARNSFMAQGHDIKTALAMAEKELAPMLQSFGGKAAGQVEDEGGGKDDTLNDDGTLTAEARASILKKSQKESVARNVDAHNRQPPSTNATGRGNRQGVPAQKNALLLTSAEYNALSEREKAIARGDIIE